MREGLLPLAPTFGPSGGMASKRRESDVDSRLSGAFNGKRRTSKGDVHRILSPGSHALGHDAGRVAFARVLSGESRAGELLVRTGGLEFLVLIPGENDGSTCGAAERFHLAGAVAHVVPFSVGRASRERRARLERTI